MNKSEANCFTYCEPRRGELSNPCPAGHGLGSLFGPSCSVSGPIAAERLIRFSFFIAHSILISGLESDHGFGQCKSLVRLNISKTKATAEGARLAMKYLPNLQLFDCPFTLHVAGQMFKVGRNSSQQPSESEIRQLPLMDLRYDRYEWSHYDKGDLDAAIKLCPSVVHVEISYTYNQPYSSLFIDEELKSLLNLKNLRNLFLEKTGRLSFEGLLPILEKFGPSTLESLVLDEFPKVDVSAIAKYCPNLRSLTLCNIDRIISPPRPLKPEDNRLRSLEHLNMSQGENHVQPYTVADMLILLSSPTLVIVDLTFDGPASELSDEVMEEAARSYRFPNLQEFDMVCDGATGRTIDCLLSLDNPLKKMVFRISGVSKEDRLKWKNLIEKNNWDLSIH